jgi:phospholipid-binding lipoprotein MlaA
VPDTALFRGALRGIAVSLWLVAICSCATPPADPAARAAFEQNNDPLEPLNRDILEFNQVVDHLVLAPVAKIYIAVLPEDGRNAIRRVLDNMKEPTLFFNNLLQGEFERAGITLGRFVLNTTLGIAGVFDVATKTGLRRQPADFGQTLFVWGFPEGPYLIIPILGPSNPRDGIGMGVDNYADPFTALAAAHGVQEFNVSRLIAGGLDQRASVIDVLEELEKNSLDFYAELRSLSQQRRAAELRHGKAPEPGIDFYLDPNQAKPESVQPSSSPGTATPSPRPPGSAPLPESARP